MSFQDLEYQRRLLKYERGFFNISFDQCENEKYRAMLEVGTRAANRDSLSLPLCSYQPHVNFAFLYNINF